MTFEAKFHGACTECDCHISPGDQIRYEGSPPHRRILHAVCPDDPTVTLRSNETVCMEHFIVKPCPECEG
jgi:hypothetical protein